MVASYARPGKLFTANSTLFTLFTAAVNVPVVYMLRLDGAGHARFGVRGMLAADGAANGVAAILLLALVVRFRPRLAKDDRARGDDKTSRARMG